MLPTHTLIKDKLLFISFLFVFVFCKNKSEGQSQGVTNWWILGYGAYWGPPGGHTTFNFFNGVPSITPDSLEMDINRTSANISDGAGNLLFYTNGYYIADASHDTMQNGNNISPTGFYNIEPEGLTVPQACLILPKPGNSNVYYLFHSTLDNGPNYNRAYYLYTSEIDMSLNGGLGGVINKNTILFQDTLNPGKITACRHANGRDWWVIVQRVNSNTYYKFLVLSNIILGPYTQSIGAPRTWTGGMASFSPDGSSYAYFYADYTANGGLDIFDFDRCSGMLSNSVHISIPQSHGFSGGLAFSGNSRYLYTGNIEKIYQFDMANPNIAASQQTVAVWDSFYSPSPPFATLFEMMQLAPDGKIYLSTGNSTFHIHVINNPDSAGIACDVVQHPIQFQYFYVNGLPNHPNYFLGCDTTSSCTCLTGINDIKENNINARAAPNPNTGIFTLQFSVQKIGGELEVYDVMGNLVHKEFISAWSQYKRVDISKQANGIYLCKLKWRDNSSSIKIIKE